MGEAWRAEHIARKEGKWSGVLVSVGVERSGRTTKYPPKAVGWVRNVAVQECGCQGFGLVWCENLVTVVQHPLGRVLLRYTLCGFVTWVADGFPGDQSSIFGWDA